MATNEQKVINITGKKYLLKDYIKTFKVKYNSVSLYSMDETGFKKFVVDKKTSEIELDENGNQQFLLLSTIPFFIDSKSVNIITHNVRIKIIYFIKNRKSEFSVDLKDTGESKSLIQVFRSRGFSIDSNTAKIWMKYITDFWNYNHLKLDEIKTSNQMGWIEDEFIPYSKKIELDLSDDLKVEESFFKSKGDREKWIQLAKRYRKNIGFRFILSSYYASPLLEILKGRNIVIHNREESRVGKTTSNHFGASIWGNPELIKINYKSSSFAIETKLSIRNNIPSFLDETQNITTDQLNNLLYMIGNGQNNAKGTKSGGLREVKTWKCIVHSTAEIPLVRDEQNEGIYNRTLEGKWRPFSSTNESKECHDFLLDNYGHTGKEFIDEIKSHTKEDLIKIKNKFENDLSNDVNLEEHIRIMSIICLADYMTKCFYDGNYEESLNMGKEILKGLITKDKVNTSERAVENLREWIVQQNANIVKDGESILNPIGIYRDGIYYIYPNMAKLYLERLGFNYKKTLDYIKDNKLALFDKKGYPIQVKINNINIRYLQLTDKFWSRESYKNVNIDDYRDKKITNDDVLHYLKILDRSEFNKIYKDIEIMFDEKNTLDIFSDISKIAQGGTVERIIAKNSYSKFYVNTFDILKGYDGNDTYKYYLKKLESLAIIDDENFKSKYLKLTKNNDEHDKLVNLIVLLDDSKEDTPKDVSTPES